MKKFIFIYTGASGKPEKIEQTTEQLVFQRFPKNTDKDSEHHDVKMFCLRAKAGDYLQTRFNLIFCIEEN
jgi:hypothetical protein